MRAAQALRQHTPGAQPTEPRARKARKQRKNLARFLACATPEELEAHAARNARYAQKQAMKQAKKQELRAMTAEERAQLSEQRRLSKAGMREHHQPVEAGEDAQECIKCGFRTHRDWCPERGRPTW